MPKEQYELKQVQVRLRLQEAEPLYSTEPITDSDKAVEIMAKALAEMDREYVCVVNLDTRKQPINFNIVSSNQNFSEGGFVQNDMQSKIFL